MQADHFYIVDGHSQIHRAYHAPMRPLSGPPGSCCECAVCEESSVCEACNGTTREPTSATYQFFKQLKQIIEHRKPSYLAICTDGPRDKLRRRQIDPAYKAHRKGSSLALQVQIKRIKQIIKLLGIPCFEVEGYEADDLIATLTKRCVSDEVHIRIVSRDKDMGKLLEDPRVMMYDPSDSTEIGPEWIRRRYKVEPRQMQDYLALVGDPTDGFKGVPGIGEKGAVKILQTFGSINKLLSKGPYNPSASKYGKFWAAASNGKLELARQLATLDCNAPLKFRPAALECNGLSLAPAAPVFRALGFSKNWE